MAKRAGVVQYRVAATEDSDGSASAPPLVSDSVLARLQRLHLWAGLLHLAVAVGVVVAVAVGDRFEFPITGDVRVVVGGDSFLRDIVECEVNTCLGRVSGERSLRDAAGGCDEFQTYVTSVFAGPKFLFKMNSVYAIVAIEFVTAAFHFLTSRDLVPVVCLPGSLVPPADRTASVCCFRYLRTGGMQSMLRANVQCLRWYEYSITSSLMAVTMASLGRMSDVYVLLGLFMGNVATMVCGAEAERVSYVRDKIKWFVTGSCFFGSVWGVIVSNFKRFWDVFGECDGQCAAGSDAKAARDFWSDLTQNNQIFNEEGRQESAAESFDDIPSWVKYAIWVPFALFFSFPALMLYTFWRQRVFSGGHKRKYVPMAPDEYAGRVETGYVALSFVSKMALAGLLLWGAAQEKPVSLLRECENK